MIIRVKRQFVELENLFPKGHYIRKLKTINEETSSHEINKCA